MSQAPTVPVGAGTSWATPCWKQAVLSFGVQASFQTHDQHCKGFSLLLGSEASFVAETEVCMSLQETYSGRRRLSIVHCFIKKPCMRGSWLDASMPCNLCTCLDQHWSCGKSAAQGAESYRDVTASIAVSQNGTDLITFMSERLVCCFVWYTRLRSVRFSELPEMQGLGDPAFTLGLLFASVGLACFIGPVFFNCVTPPK